jgi:phage protein
VPDAQREALRKKFKGMMSALYRQEGAMMEVEILKDKEVLDFIDTHAAVLDSTFEKVKMSDTMRSSLQQSNWVFSGMKTFHELKEAFPSLIDEKGEKKPFERFYNDVQRVDETYNRNYLRAEYNFVSTSAEMAARWEEFEKDGDRYFLQYRTVGDDRVRKEHAALDATTLPVEHPFWDTHYPPNGWNCRCNVVQVRKSRYPATSEDELIDRKKALAEEQARHKGKSEMFRFNPGKQRKTFPDYNPYTIKRCGDCDIAKGKFAKVEESELCVGCGLLRKCLHARQENKKIKISFEEWERILSKPIADQYETIYKGQKGKVYEHELVCRNNPDHNRVVEVAKAFANQFGNSLHLPEIPRIFQDGRKKVYTELPKESNANPDLYIEGLGYVDVKSPKKIMNSCSNANKASKHQYACVCLTDHEFKGHPITERQIQDRNNAIWESEDYTHDYIFWYICGELKTYKRP